MFPGLSDPLLYSFIAEEPPLGPAALARRYEKLEARVSPDGNALWLNWAVRVKSNGYAGYVQATVPRGGPAEIAYVIFTAHQRLGYAREAAAAMLVHLNTAAGVQEAAAFVDTRNKASIRVIEALGFHRVATHVMREKLRGVFIDDHEYRKLL